MSKAIISIPIYKKVISELEKASLIQCCKILNKYDFSLVCPNSLEIEEYEKILNNFNVRYGIERFDDRFFKSIESYNELMLNVDFYRKHNKYDFMLVYQLDAYVFRDELEYWCKKDYDYIGAPWFEGFSLGEKNSKLLDVAGNGGLSLRKVKSFINILNHNKELVGKYIKEGQNEDMFFSKLAKDIDGNFKVAKPHEAVEFSFETNPGQLYEMNGNKLPFGCHAWERYDFDFWEKFIDLSGVDFRKENRINLKSNSKLRADLDRKKADLDRKKIEIGIMKQEMEQKIESLNQELQAIHFSPEWKVASLLRRFVEVAMPEGTLRRNIFLKLWVLTISSLHFSLGIYRKIAGVFFIAQNYLSKAKFGKKREINLNSKKLVYIGHSYHNKTNSTGFLIEYLREKYEVEVISDESWIGKPFPDLSFIDESYLGVVFFQLLPSKDIIDNIKNDNIIFFPMYDQSGRWGVDFWMKYRDLKIINFSKHLHDKLKRWGFESMYVQFFPKPQDFFPGEKDGVFFWQRLTNININTISKIFSKTNVKMHIHKAIDPWHKFIQPTEKQEKKFQITYSDWFETREEMWEVIRQKGIYVAPREYEGIGLSFLEAMAMGKAVIAVDNPTMNEYIEHGKTGYLFDLKKPKPIDFSNIEQVQKNTYEFMKRGYEKWEKDKMKIIDFIKKV